MPTPLILIIDDDKLFRWSVSRILEGASYRVQEAVTGEEGSAAIRDGQPDLVLLDIRLPDLDGLAILQATRQARPDLPVVIVAGDPTPETAREALRLGARAYLEKPCDWTVLLAAVSQALQPPAAPGQTGE